VRAYARSSALLHLAQPSCPAMSSGVNSCIPSVRPFYEHQESSKTPPRRLGLSWGGDVIASFDRNLDSRLGTRTSIGSQEETHGLQGRSLIHKLMTSKKWDPSAEVPNASFAAHDEAIPTVSLTFQRFAQFTRMGPGVPQQYTSLSDKPFIFCVALMVSRLGYCMAYGFIFLWGWLNVGMPWHMLVGTVFAMVGTMTEGVIVHAIGPIVWCQTAAGLVTLTLHCVVFSFNTIYPLFQRMEDKPFQSRALLLLGSGLSVGFAGVIGGQASSIRDIVARWFAIYMRWHCWFKFVAFRDSF
jgi:hypothetical protein